MCVKADQQHSDEMQLSEKVSDFIHHLRSNNFSVGTARTLTILQVLSTSDISNLNTIRASLKIMLCNCKEHWDSFDDLFEAYWFGRGRVRSQPRASKQLSGPAQPKLWQQHLGETGDNVGGKHVPQIESEQSDLAQGEAAGKLIATRDSSLTRTDLRHVVDPEAMKEAEALAYRLARAIRYRLSRRYRVNGRSQKINLRRTLRANLGHGGEPLKLIHNSRPSQPVRIVIFLDVSGSMKHYSRFFLQFVKGLVSQWSDTDVFLFHTKLIRVSDVLKQRDAMAAMGRMALIAEGFGGGTRLGDCLDNFNRLYAKSAINSRTVVFIVSDGYDTGSNEHLAIQLAQLKRRARKLVWLNPLLGWKNYAPVNAAMKTALPFVDFFAAANTIESLGKIEPMLERM